MARTATRATRTTRRARTPRASSRVSDITVKVGRTGGRVVEVLVPAGSTVEEALNASELTYNSTDRIRVRGRQATLDTELSNGDIVTLAGKISGAGK